MAKKTFKDLQSGDNVYEVVKNNTEIVTHKVEKTCRYYGGGGNFNLEDKSYFRIHSLNQNRVKGKYFLNEEDAKFFIDWVKTAKTFGKLEVGDTIYCITENNTIEEVVIGDISDRDKYQNGELYRYFYDQAKKHIFTTKYGLTYDKILKEYDETESSFDYYCHYLRIFINKSDAEKDVIARAKRQKKATFDKEMNIKPNGFLLTKKDRFGNDLHVGDKVHYIYSYPKPGFAKTTLYTINEGVVTDETKETISVKCTAPSDMDGTMNKTTPDRIVVIKKWDE